MRKSNREVRDFDQIVQIMRECDTCRLALNDDEVPYIIPLNFEIWINGQQVTLLFHIATGGRKLELIEKDPRASFEMDCDHLLQYFEDRGYCTMAYQSVIGCGTIRVLPDEQKREALCAIMDHYHPDGGASFNEAAIPRTVVYALDVESMTGKRKDPK